jgi:hypothetical protein
MGVVQSSSKHIKVYVGYTRKVYGRTGGAGMEIRGHGASDMVDVSAGEVTWVGVSKGEHYGIMHMQGVWANGQAGTEI